MFISKIDQLIPTILLPEKEGNVTMDILLERIHNGTEHPQQHLYSKHKDGVLQGSYLFIFSCKHAAYIYLGSNPRFLQLKHGILTTGPPGKSLQGSFLSGPST